MFLFKKKKINSKFSKGDKVIILTRPYDDLKGRTAIVKNIRKQCEDGKCIYSIDIEILPSNYLLIQNQIPRVFHEDELDFYDISKRRNFIIIDLFK